MGRSLEKSGEQELHSDPSQKPNSSSESESVQTDDDDDEGGQRRLLHSEPQVVPLSCYRGNHQFLQQIINGRCSEGVSRTLRDFSKVST